MYSENYLETQATKNMWLIWAPELTRDWGTAFCSQSTCKTQWRKVNLEDTVFSPNCNALIIQIHALDLVTTFINMVTGSFDSPADKFNFWLTWRLILCWTHLGVYLIHLQRGLMLRFRESQATSGAEVAVWEYVVSWGTYLLILPRYISVNSTDHFCFGNINNLRWILLRYISENSTQEHYGI